MDSHRIRFQLVAALLLIGCHLGPPPRSDCYPATVTGASMVPALTSGQRVMVCPGMPQKGQLVVFQFGYREMRGWPPIVKRCVAVPGDTIAGITLEAGYYWVAADNRDTKYDSRTFGPIHESQIIGIVQWP